MQKHCPENERIKREYLKFLKHARRRSEASLDMAAKAIDRFEAYVRHRNFKEFRRQQALHGMLGGLAKLKPILMIQNEAGEREKKDQQQSGKRRVDVHRPGRLDQQAIAARS